MLNLTGDLFFVIQPILFVVLPFHSDNDKWTLIFLYVLKIAIQNLEIGYFLLVLGTTISDRLAVQSVVEQGIEHLEFYARCSALNKFFLIYL